MQVTFWGTRGSIAKAGPTTVRYGGNTSCIEVRSDGGTLLVLDCGTGAHGLGEDLVKREGGAPAEGHLLISHTHWDHIQGLPFFAPLFHEGSRWNIYGPRGLGNSIAETLAGQMQYSYFPVSIDQLAAHVEYHDLVEGRFEIDDITIVTQYLNHPALTLGYRIEVDGASVVYSSDHEPFDRSLGLGGDPSQSSNDRHHIEFLADADLVIHDAQYLAEEYPAKMGWGHSTVEYVVDAAAWGNVRQLALFHHDPSRDDDAVAALVDQAQQRAAGQGSDMVVFAAAEGATVELRGDATTPLRAGIGGATDKPAIEQMGREVLIAVSDPEMGTVLRQAAEAEGLVVNMGIDPVKVLAAAKRSQPSFILIDDDDAAMATARALRALDPPYGGEVGLVAVGRTAHGAADAHSTMISDWLTWPASGVYVRTRLRAWMLRRACRWRNAPLPPNERARVQALRDLAILDTAPEERFDQFTRHASSVLDVPIALVSLVDSDRQWFKSRHGIDVDETPRDMALCAHAILEDDILQVTDALDDDRFADNPLVTGDPRLRFYAGVPLTLSNGHRVGTFCVLDYRPRLLDEDQLGDLRRIGALVVEQLEVASEAP